MLNHARTVALLSDLFPSSSFAFLLHPHVFALNTRENLDILLDVAASNGVGLFGRPPPFDEHGQSYLESEDGVTADDFGLWALPQNRPCATSGPSHECGFEMLIPISALPSVRTLYESYDGPTDHFSFHHCMGLLPSWLEHIGWAILAVGPDDLVLMLITRAADCYLVKSAKERFAASGEATACVKRTPPEQLNWVGPTWLDLNAM